MAQDREQLISQDFLGVIYNTVKFCDFYSYEYARLKNTAGVPLLKIETDHTDSNSGQILTRIDAFLESTDTKRNPNNAELALRANGEEDAVHESGNLMYTCLLYTSRCV